MNREDIGHLVKADSLVNLSFIGILIPIAGLVIANFANTKIKLLTYIYGSHHPEIKRVREKIIVSVLWSIISIVLNILGVLLLIFIEARKQGYTNLIEFWSR